MKIAIPLFGSRISPHFDYAPMTHIFTIEGGSVIKINEISFEGWGLEERIAHLINCGVETVICGGLSKVVQNSLDGKSIRVIPWVTGEAQEALQLFLQGRLDPGTILCPGRKRRWRFCTTQRRRRRLY